MEKTKSLKTTKKPRKLILGGTRKPNENLTRRWMLICKNNWPKRLQNGLLRIKRTPSSKQKWPTRWLTRGRARKKLESNWKLKKRD